MMNDKATSPHHGMALNLARLLNAVTIVVAVAVMIGIIINLVDGASVVTYILAIYTLIFAVGIILVELGRPTKLQATALYMWWPLRGAVYAYLGFVTAELADGKGGAEEVFGEITGWAMVVIGALYAILGFACFNKLVSHRQEQFTEAQRTQKSAEAIRAATPAQAAPQSAV